MIEMRRAQLSFGDGLIADEVDDLCEEWMKHADQVLTDDQIVTAVYEALAKRHPKSRSRGRLGAPAEVVLRLSSVRLKLEQFQLPVGDKVVFDRIDALEGLLQRQFLEERQRQNL